MHLRRLTCFIDEIAICYNFIIAAFMRYIHLMLMHMLWLKSSTTKRIMQKVDGMITVRSPRFLTALLFLRANLRSFVAKQNYMTKVLWCCVPFCFCVKLSEFICSYEYKIETEKEKREVKKKICTEELFINNESTINWNMLLIYKLLILQ